MFDRQDLKLRFGPYRTAKVKYGACAVDSRGRRLVPDASAGRGRPAHGAVVFGREVAATRAGLAGWEATGEQVGHRQVATDEAADGQAIIAAMSRQFQFGSLGQRFSRFVGAFRSLFFVVKKKADMGTVQFDDEEAWLLYSFPKPPSDLQMVIRCYTFINRTSNPTYEELTNCLAKAQQAGIVREQRGEWVVENNWYREIHAADHKSANEIESLLAFADTFVGVSIPVVTHRVRVVSQVEYDAVVDALKREWEKVMASVRRRCGDAGRQ